MTSTSNLPDRRAALGLLAGATALAAGAWAKADPVSDEVVRGLQKAVRDKYVDAERAPAVAAELERRRRGGAYGGLAGAALAQRLTADLRELTADKHFGVFPPDEPPADTAPGSTPPPPFDIGEIIHAQNFGVDRFERLRGNIGRLKLNSFPELTPEVEATYAAAMGMARHTYGLVIDMTANDGGDPSSLHHLMGYFVAGPRPVSRLTWRDKPEETFSLPASVPGPSYGAERPVVLTVSKDTFSAGEGFVYGLKAFGRATVVGETTGGGGNPGYGLPIGRGFVAFVPAGRSINVVTGRGWDGAGITPDVAAAGEAIQPAAYRTVLERALTLPGTPTREQVLRGALGALTAT